MKKTDITTITTYQSYKGGINNLKVVHVINGYLTLQIFTGKSAIRQADKFITNFLAS